MNIEKEKKQLERDFQAVLDHFGDGDGLASAVSVLMDRSYYEHGENPATWEFPKCTAKTPMQWVLVEQLPTEEFEGEDRYRPKERMQGLLNTLRGLCSKAAFLLIRKDGYTRLYLGIHAENLGSVASESLCRLSQIHLPGAKFCSDVDSREIEHPLRAMSYSGIVTGQPSVRWGDRENPLQSLDRISNGIRSSETGAEHNYALLILAESTSDKEVKEVLQKVLRLKSDLNEYRKYTESKTIGSSKSTGFNYGLSANIGGEMVMLALTAAGLSYGTANLIRQGLNGITNAINVGLSAYAGRSVNKQVSSGRSVSYEHVNFMIEYCMGLLDKMITRLEAGRNQGFWNTAAYILAEDNHTVQMVSSAVRAVYSGQDTYQEPLRCFSFGESQTVHQYVQNMQLLPLPVNHDVLELKKVVSPDESWHVFGKLYESMSTPVNTEELSIMMSLPRKDVAGLEIKKNAVVFSTNPPDIKDRRTIPLGDILDMGSKVGHAYPFDIDQLNGHGLLVGKSGEGKSVTSRRILRGMLAHNIPFMVIDPAKMDYVRWADTYNQKHQGEPGFKPIKIYAPGLKNIAGIKTPISELTMNPFQPYAAKDAPLNMMGHIAALLSLLRRTMAMGDFLPMLLDEAVYNYTEGFFGPDIAQSAEADPCEVTEFPTFSGLMEQIDALLADRQYSEENTKNFKAAMETRIHSLLHGWKRNFFEAEHSTPAEDLFESNVVICLAGVVDNNDKAFFMSLLLQAATEYRSSRYQYDEAYITEVSTGRENYGGSYLAHYTILEEAHRLIQVPRGFSADADSQTVIAEKFCEMLSEARETGEGIMIIDQYPSRLVPDAVKNTNVKIIHRLPARDDQETTASCMSLNADQSRLLATLKKGDAIIHSGQDNAAMWLHVFYDPKA